ncbi:MAG: urease accessory protein UreF [Alphaproteobacteria bacterium]|nr:urease accessory protein UreF [Alphaproteobacteria bacterium]
MTIDQAPLLRLLAWLSPSFPVGSFAYSHGLEAARELDLVTDRASLTDWIDGAVAFGSARNDAVILACAHRAVIEDDVEALREVADVAATLFGSPELAGESLGQGTAFWRTVAVAWPHPRFERLTAILPRGRIAYPVAVATAAAVHGVSRRDTLAAFLHGFAANAVSAAIRLGIIGQTDGQIATSRLEERVASISDSVHDATLDDIGSASLMIDLLTLWHETQTTRLFRS